MTSADVKSHLMWYLLYQRQYLACATEYGGRGADGIADVFAISKAGMTHEFEVKVNKADLMGELNSIQLELARQGGTLFEERHNGIKNVRKFSKHSYYLGKEGYLSNVRERPNHFSFVVPTELSKIAVDACKGTPYGVLAIDAANNIFSCRNVGRLHKKPVENQVLYNFLHKLSTEVDILRRDKLRVKAEPPT